MRIIGQGFVAKNLAPLAWRHPHATVLACGVPSTREVSTEAFAREQRLVRSTLERGRREGTVTVFLSTAAMSLYGGSDSPAHEDRPIRPTTPYGRHKHDLEQLIAESGARWLTLRSSHLVGRWQPVYQLVPALVAQIRRGSVAVHRGAYRDLLAAEHFVEVVDRLLTAGVEGRIVNVASGHAVPVEQIVDGVEQRLGLRAGRTWADTGERHVPVDIARLCALISEPASFGFWPTYWERVLDRHVVPETPAAIA